jgi:hypothetical protein
MKKNARLSKVEFAKGLSAWLPSEGVGNQAACFGVDRSAPLFRGGPWVTRHTWRQRIRARIGGLVVSLGYWLGG